MEKQTLATVVSRDAVGDEPSITISTAALDRQYDEIVPEGADFTAYRRNPVVLYGHDYASLPVGATTRLDIAPGVGIKASWKWLVGDPFADRVRNAFDQGVLRAASVGFRPTASEPNGKGGKRFTKWDLLEWSIVPVPANPEAVRVLRGLGLWDGYGRAAADVIDIEIEDGSELLDIEIDDDGEELPGVEPRDIAQALRDVLPGAVRDFVQAEAVKAVARARGRAWDDPLPDPATRHHRDIGVTKADVEAAMRSAIREAVAQMVRETTESTVRRLRGRVD